MEGKQEGREGKREGGKEYCAIFVCACGRMCVCVGGGV